MPLIASLFAQTSSTTTDDQSPIGGLIVLAIVAYLIYRWRRNRKLRGGSGNKSSSPSTKKHAFRESRSSRTVTGRKREYSPQPPTGVPTRVWANKSTRIEVVGETFYEDSYRAIFKNDPSFKTYSGTERFTELVLAPNPDNPHDRYAVSVWADGYQIGHMPRGDARVFHSQIAGLEPDGLLAVDGRIWSSDKDDRVNSRAYFDIPDINMFKVVGEPPNPATDIELPVGSKIQVIGEEHHMDTLSTLFDGDGGEQPVWVRLRTSIDFRPRSARERVDVFVGESRIGWLSDIQTKNMLPLIKLAEDQGKTAVARGVISGSVLAAEVVLHVVKASEVNRQWVESNSGPSEPKQKRPEFMWDDDDL